LLAGAYERGDVDGDLSAGVYRGGVGAAAAGSESESEREDKS